MSKLQLEINDNYRSNYIQITRAKEHLSIYTTSKNWLIEHLTDARNMKAADKTSAYEVMHQSKVSLHNQPVKTAAKTVKAVKKITNESNFINFRFF